MLHHRCTLSARLQQLLAPPTPPQVQRVEARIAEATALPVSHAENLQVLK